MNVVNILEKHNAYLRTERVYRSAKVFTVLLLLLLNSNLFAQTIDQRAEDIQNGTFNLFMSADQSYYKGNNDPNNTSSPYGYGYWVTAHALETLADAYQRTRNSVYRDRMKSIIAGVRKYNSYGAGTYHNDYYDDLEWLCLATFNCYNATKDPEFLDAVHQIWTEIKTGYANGAMSWRKGCTTPCNNSIANGPAIIIAVKLYQLEGDNANLQMAKDIHTWMKANVFNAQGGIWDSPGNTNPDWQFSYNSGMFIGACLELSIVTGAQSYIDDGIKASEFMMNYRNYNGGVFFLNEKGQGDGGLFKGIFGKYFTEFVRVGNLTTEQKQRYLKVINYTGDYAWANGVNKSNFLIGPDWGALPSGTIDLSTQVSGVHLFESVASLNKVHVYQNINYSGFYSQLPLGNYTLAQLQARGVVDNDITSFTIPIGYTVTVYENDNFTGASATYTANTAWLADWNDRITSMKIADANTHVVTAYQDINFGGYSGGLDVGNYTLAQLQARGILDNDITSFKISSGYKITVYDGDNFTGTSADYTADVTWLADWNDKITSLKIIDIRPHVVTAFQDVNYGGYSGGLDVGNYTLIELQAAGILDNDITSFKIAPGYKVTAYDGDNFTGASADFSTDISWLADWNDKITSLKVIPVSIIGTGDGLTANYFNGMNFETPVYTRKDATINFDWGNGSPDASVHADQFSVRWSGQIQPKYSEVYTFTMNTDNGRRLWINGQLVIDKWIDDWGIDYTGTITLVAGQKYDIKVEYFENNGGANAKLQWSSASQAKEIVPTSQLYSNALPTVSISSPTNNASVNAGTIAITANASDNGSIVKVEFYNGATLLGTSTSNPYSYSWTGVAAGTYSLTARATDNQGGITVSSAVSLTVKAVVVVNQAPTVSLTSPANGSSSNAPASITVSVNASDADGTVSKVDFYNGTTLLYSDATSPYGYTWTSVGAGTYTLSAKATDNSGAVAASGSVIITVVAVATNKCSGIAAYKENNGYVAGSKVTNAGKQYECKEYPYSGWCNGAAWAYAPGTGSYWTDAWYDRGSCTARTEAQQDAATDEIILIIPNPTTDMITINLNEASSISVYNSQGREVMSNIKVSAHGEVYLNGLSSGMYLVKIDTGSTITTQMLIKN
ncbi:MAG: glycoside hydrolase family 76 [Chitinophagaceae bacterium]|nr:glycoside hydrolase family 76 [Chitinophagaceae bacterium]